MSKKEFSTVIQGRIHRHSLDGVLNYKKYSEVIISGWHDPKCPHMSHPGLKEGTLVLTPVMKPQILKNYFNAKNLYLQIITTLQGLYQVRTPYVIKVRSDESFSNLVPFQNLVKTTKKVVSSNIYFRPDKVYKFHMSDHMIGCSTKEMIKAFELAKYRCEKHMYFLDRGITYYSDDNDLASDADRKRILSATPSKPLRMSLPPETILCTSFLMNRKKKVSNEQSKTLMLENFAVCRVEWLGKCRFKDGKYRRPDSPLAQINYMSQI